MIGIEGKINGINTGWGKTGLKIVSLKNNLEDGVDRDSMRRCGRG